MSPLLSAGVKPCGVWRKKSPLWAQGTITFQREEDLRAWEKVRVSPEEDVGGGEAWGQDLKNKAGAGRHSLGTNSTGRSTEQLSGPD